MLNRNCALLRPLVTGLDAVQNGRRPVDLGLKAKGEMIMRALLILIAVCFSANAHAQTTTPPKVGNKPLAQVKPQAPMGCRLVGTVKGTKLWAGECVAATELRAAAPTGETEPQPSPAQATGAN
jgi:hypothetical protein